MSTTKSSSKKQKREAISKDEGVSSKLPNSPRAKLEPAPTSCDEPAISTTATASSKKRKHELISDDNGVSLKLSSSTSGKIGPELVIYPSLEAPASTPFRCYVRGKTEINDATNTTSRKPSNVDDILVVGETKSVEFVSNNEEGKGILQSGCRYLVSVYDRSTGSVTVLPVSKSPFALSRTVKKLKSLPPAPTPSPLAYKEARANLGETFGTKKAKLAIRAQERNHIDVGAMEGVMDLVMDGIEKGSGGLMTQEQVNDTADENKLIPPHSSTATKPEDIYPLHEIIPEVEWKLLSVGALEQTESEKARIALLPFRHSRWINDHLERLLGASGKGKKKKKTMKLLIYISAMMMFYKASHWKLTVDKDNLIYKMTNIPEPIVDSLLSRFSEVSRGSNSHQVTPTAKTTLLTYMLALCLKVDNYATDTAVIAHDLSMSVTSVNQLFKTLGCKISTLNAQELSLLGLPQSTGVNNKRAVLTAPVTFPKPKAGKRR
ncbi:hypothetical protein M378DRAFT_87941 [Amanita muscaria Koide BX008]|uniref:Rpa49 subunit specific to nuclear RNA polymerase I n=1 Tax=Amanita muscaria (strain Koide BX008) TaxID=946122 RepID=A0A0C2WMK2_AMAMK|nr:hypothetical protein M378DRAFT_87941 [Amanita muscaria Koide BX008]